MKNKRAKTKGRSRKACWSKHSMPGPTSHRLRCKPNKRTSSCALLKLTDQRQSCLDRRRRRWRETTAEQAGYQPHGLAYGRPHNGGAQKGLASLKPLVTKRGYLVQLLSKPCHTKQLPQVPVGITHNSAMCSPSRANQEQYPKQCGTTTKAGSHVPYARGEATSTSRTGQQ